MVKPQNMQIEYLFLISLKCDLNLKHIYQCFAQLNKIMKMCELLDLN